MAGPLRALTCGEATYLPSSVSDPCRGSVSAFRQAGLPPRCAGIVRVAPIKALHRSFRQPRGRSRLHARQGRPCPVPVPFVAETSSTASGLDPRPPFSGPRPGPRSLGRPRPERTPARGSMRSPPFSGGRLLRTVHCPCSLGNCGPCHPPHGGRGAAGADSAGPDSRSQPSPESPGIGPAFHPVARRLRSETETDPGTFSYLGMIPPGQRRHKSKPK